MARALPKCKAHPDCFANIDGCCRVLDDCKVRKRLPTDPANGAPTGKEYPCPFYKSKSVITLEQIQKECKQYASTKLKED